MKKLIFLIKLLFLSSILLPFKKNKNKIIINSYMNEKYIFYSRVFFEFLIENKNRHKFTVKFVIDDEKYREQLNNDIGPYFINSRTIGGMIEILNANFWISSCKPIYTFPLSLLNRVKINVWHGIPFKKIALKDKNQSRIKKIIYRYYYSNFFYDLFLCSSNETKELFKESFYLHEKTTYVGGSLVGEMFNKSADKKINAIINDTLKKGRAKKILYAPTYRDNKSTLYFPFSEIEKNEFESFLEKNNVTIYIRPHHLDDEYKKYINWDGVEYLGSDIVPEITFYLNYFDILISDYSSIIFDYMLTEGKQIILPYDYEEYRRVRGLNYEISDISYGSVVSNYIEFKNAIEYPIQNDKQKEELKLRFHSIESFQCQQLLTKILKYRNEKNN